MIEHHRQYRHTDQERYPGPGSAAGGTSFVPETVQRPGDVGGDSINAKGLVPTSRPRLQRHRRRSDSERIGEGTTGCLVGPPVHRWRGHRDNQGGAVRTYVPAPDPDTGRTRLDPNGNGELVTDAAYRGLSHRHHRWRYALARPVGRLPERSGHRV